MKIKLRTVFGKCHEIDVSKLATVASIKEIVKDVFKIDIPKQRLFYGGKQLDDKCTMYDYSINLEDVIQVMEKAEPHIETARSEKSEQKEEAGSAEVTQEDASALHQVTSLYFKVGDYVYCRDARSGAWSDGKIVAIFNDDTPEEIEVEEELFKKDDANDIETDNLLYKVELDLPSDEGARELTVKLNDIRLCTFENLKIEDVQVGMKLIGNYNMDRKNEPGNWFEIEVTKVKVSRYHTEVWANILMGQSFLNDCKINFCYDLKNIEPHIKIEERDPTKIGEGICLEEPCCRCKGNPNVKCKECNCIKCGGKDQPEEQILCDECNDAYHIGCLNPPLAALPTEDNWFCPDCKINTSEIVAPGSELKQSKKKSKVVPTKPIEEGKKERDWGCGHATVGVAKKCTIVPSHHFGSIPGVEVGTRWAFRVKAAESGVHRPPVAGIHGRENLGAFSIVLSGGYEDDVDKGDEFYYTGSGGRDLSGNKRVAAQSSDQTLTKTNLALAMNCNAPIDKIKGSSATDWKGGKPVRVLRGFKLAKHSKFAPKVGVRYDGIYKVVRYFPQKGKSGYIVWRYVLRRDDPSPAPWTPAGQKFIQEHGLEEIIGADEKDEKEKSSKKRKASDNIDEEAPAAPSKKQKVAAYKPDSEMNKLIKSDTNDKIWAECLSFLQSGKLVFMEKVRENFTCVCCQELVSKPITTPCGHNMCLSCLKRSFAASVYQCPCCRGELGESYELQVNNTLSNILVSLFPGYNNDR